MIHRFLNVDNDDLIGLHESVKCVQNACCCGSTSCFESGGCWENRADTEVIAWSKCTKQLIGDKILPRGKEDKQMNTLPGPPVMNRV